MTGAMPKALKKKASELKSTGLGKVSWIAKEGFAGDEIIKLGRHTDKSLIAMCSHGRSGVKRWVLGSVAETVARHAGQPVLIIRAAS
jgi:nucleotide-binding universal stress UspA family protein